MNNNSHTRALVLAGAGAAGNAWQLGLIAGLAEAGVDLTTADVIIGTSAGSTVAAQITSGTSPADLYAAILTQVVPEGARPMMSGQAYMDWSQQIIDDAKDADDMRRTLAAAALEKDETDGAASARWRQIVGARLPNQEWPEQRVLITALNARTAEPIVFDRDSGVELVDAVAASTSPLTPYAIGDERYLNGSYRRGSNSDLATGYDRVVVLEPFSGRSRTPVEWGMDLATQVEELRASGSTVEVVFPDAGSGDVFNANALDPSTRLPAARGGYAQGKAGGERLRQFWPSM